MLVNKSPYRLIALDLDGTTLNSRQVITPRTREALKGARERGIVTVVATGRAPHSALFWSREIGGGPVICCNGAAILEPTGNVIAIRELARAPLQRVLAIAREVGVLAECYTMEGILLDRPLAQVKAYLGWVRPHVSPLRAMAGLVRLWRVNRMRLVGNLVKWAERPQLPAVLKVMIVGERGQLARFAEQVNRELPGLEVSNSGFDNLEITAAGVTKATGLAQLAARLQIPREATIAFGDSENDLAMLAYAGVGVAMDNATDAVKRVADRVTRSNNEDGVAHLIEELCLS